MVIVYDSVIIVIILIIYYCSLTSDLGLVANEDIIFIRCVWLLQRLVLLEIAMTHVAARGAASGVNETLLLVLDAFIAMLQCILFSVMTAFGNKIVFIFLLYKRHYRPIHVLISNVQLWTVIFARLLSMSVCPVDSSRLSIHMLRRLGVYVTLQAPKLPLRVAPCWRPLNRDVYAYLVFFLCPLIYADNRQRGRRCSIWRYGPINSSQLVTEWSVRSQTVYESNTA